MPRSGDGTGRAHDTICTAMTDPADSYTQARTDTGLTRDTTVRRLDSDYQQLIDQLRAKFRQASQALTAATIAAVPDTTVTGFTAGGGTGMMPGWCTKDGGTFPPDLHAETALGGAHLLADRQQLLAGQAVADRFNQYLADSTTHSKTEIEAFLARLHPYSAAFRQGFLATVDLNTLLTVQRLSHGGPGIDEQTARAYGGRGGRRALALRGPRRSVCTTSQSPNTRPRTPRGTTSATTGNSPGTRNCAATGSSTPTNWDG
jgi:hypothetical protein